MVNSSPRHDPASIIHVKCQCGELYHIGKEHLGKRIRCIKCKNLLALPEPAQGSVPQPLPVESIPENHEHFIETSESSRVISLNWNVVQYTVAGIIFIVAVFLIFTYSTERASSDQAGDHPVQQPKMTVRQNDRQQSRQEDSYPIQFTLGSFDERFGITKNNFLDFIYQAKDLWEQPTGMSLFRYDPSAAFKINLVFDDREQRLIDERRLKSQITATGKSFNDLKQEYDANRDQKNELEDAYNDRVFIYKKNMERHKSSIAYWNDKGGAPPDQYTILQQEEADLNKTAASLERERLVLNDIIDKTNTMGGQLNDLINKYNLQIEYYNGQFVDAREFEKGVYDGNEINIYEFDDENDLKITLVHEMGHALGFDHVDDPSAVMYYKLEKQDLRSIHLAPADLELLRQKFPGTAVAHSN